MNSKNKPKRKKRKFSLRSFYSEMIKLFGGLGLYLYLRPKVYRVSEKTPKKIKGGVLIAANHTSMLDPLILFCVFWYRRLHFPATKELFRKRINRFFFKNMNCILIDKDAFNTAALRTMCELLKENKAIAIFPEGAINTNEALMNYKMGTAFMAKKSGKPVLPVYIAQRKKWWQSIPVVIGEPVDVAAICKDSPRSEALMRASETLRNIEAGLAEYFESNIKGKRERNKK
ncbi:MAG: 1-acyl-sn-glycerol-3-phosphate acyltransferase [Clostridia bacterium]|nr:1-acyl-sn-glycerol-3-phosphate acyltransferase [Clostridia bacterium]